MENVHHEKVIFWDFEAPIDLVNQARILGTRGFIATQPDVPKVTPEVLLSKYLTIPQLQKRWDASAVPWIKFLKDKLVDATPSDALRMLEHANHTFNSVRSGTSLPPCVARKKGVS
jgi:hypothetical protein